MENLIKIKEIEQINFSNQSDVKMLYNKAKDIETQLVNIDYIGKPSNISRLVEITDQLDKKNTRYHGYSNAWF